MGTTKRPSDDTIVQFPGVSSDKTRRPAARAAPAPLKFVAPLVELSHATRFELLGMNSRQETMAFYAAMNDPDMYVRMAKALSRGIKAQEEFEEALHAYRLELLNAMALQHPAAARRIAAGLPPGADRFRKRCVRCWTASYRAERRRCRRRADRQPDPSSAR